MASTSSLRNGKVNILIKKILFMYKNFKYSNLQRL